MVRGDCAARGLAGQERFCPAGWRGVADGFGLVLSGKQLRGMGGLEHVPEDGRRIGDVLRRRAAVLPQRGGVRPVLLSGVFWDWLSREPSPGRGRCRRAVSLNSDSSERAGRGVRPFYFWAGRTW